MQMHEGNVLYIAERFEGSNSQTYEFKVEFGVIHNFVLCF